MKVTEKKGHGGYEVFERLLDTVSYVSACNKNDLWNRCNTIISRSVILTTSMNRNNIYKTYGAVDT